MPYSTAVAGTTITASWANANVRDQVVTPFASTSARDSAITAPVAGMIAYLTSNDASEGLTSRTSAATWRKPWNMPWGTLDYAQVTASQTGITTAVDLTSLTSTITYVANRRIVIDAQGAFLSTVAGDLGRLDITDATPTIQNAAQQVIQASNVFINARAIVTPAAGSKQYKLQYSRTAGTGSHSLVASATQPAFIYIHDDGPNGAPA